MLNVLFVSCYSVDINNSASIELIYYMNLLAGSGEFNVHLLTMDFPKSSIYYDKELLKIVHKKIKIHRVGGGVILNKIIPKVNAKTELNSRRNLMLINIKNLVNIIDPYLSWSYKAYSYFKRNLCDFDFDIILGMHEPPSSLICSYMIKDFLVRQGKNTRLVSYFSDPYCNEPNRKSKNFIVRKINSIIEKKIVRKSDKFLFVTENNSNYFSNRYGIDINTYELIHRNFNGEFLNQFKDDYPEQFSKNKINLLYAGDIVKGIRDITQFVNTIDHIFMNRKDMFSKLNINFYGNIKDNAQANFVKSREYIKFKGRISYFKIINLMVHADVLIIFGNKEFNQIPAKVYDYLGTDAYILVILESYNDPLYSLVKDIDGVVCVLNNLNDIYLGLNKIIDEIDYIPRKFDRNTFKESCIFDKIKNIFYN